MKTRITSEWRGFDVEKGLAAERGMQWDMAVHRVNRGGNRRDQLNNKEFRAQ